MGDPRRIRKKYQMPSHPWQKTRIDEEKAVKKEYGIPRNREIWRMASKLKDFKDRVKKLITRQDKQAELEKSQLLSKLHTLGLLQVDHGLDQILSLTLRNVLDRRLQSVLVRKSLARSMSQARQMIVHKKVLVDGKAINIPSFVVTRDLESKISLKERKFKEKIIQEKAVEVAI